MRLQCAGVSPHIFTLKHKLNLFSILCAENKCIYVTTTKYETTLENIFCSRLGVHGAYKTKDQDASLNAQIFRYT